MLWRPPPLDARKRTGNQHCKGINYHGATFGRATKRRPASQWFWLSLPLRLLTSFQFSHKQEHVKLLQNAIPMGLDGGENRSGGAKGLDVVFRD